MGGGLTDWHRQKRKREQQKNKEQRIAARDTKVKETKTVVSVRNEIRNVEQQYKNAELRPHHIQSKLDRLNKELKIVQKEESSSSSGAPLSHHQSSTKEPEWKPLENPSLSVYFHPVMNPYGEPAPGQPRLFHRPDGGTTTNLREAGLPGQRPPPPPPPPRPDNRMQKKTVLSKRNDDDSKSYERPGSNSPATITKEQPQSSTMNNSYELSPAIHRPKRYGRQKDVGNIWASGSDESDNEGKHECSGRAQNDRALTLDQQNHDPTSFPASSQAEWYYQDKAGRLQGPFSTMQMQQWIQAGFFASNQNICSSATGTWNTLQNTPPLRDCIPREKSVRREEKMEETKLSSVQDRIAALRASHVRTMDESPGQDRDVEPNSHVWQSKIPTRIDDTLIQRDAADASGVHVRASDSKPCDQSRVDEIEPPVDSLEGRIAALRADYVAAHSDANAEYESDHAISQPTCDDDQDAGLHHTEDERPYYQDDVSPEDMSNVPYPSSEMGAVIPADMSNVPYPVNDLDVGNEIDENGEYGASSYPIDEADMADIPYPVHDEYEAEQELVTDDTLDVFPLSTEQESLHSKVGVAAGSESWPTAQDSNSGERGIYEVIGSYPVTATYPEGLEEDEDEILQVEKKKPRLDKEVLTLLPSHVQKRQNKRL